jgi:glyoxylase-like metal-dependent hydrolase (beta-lactamase superfamily II)
MKYTGSDVIIPIKIATPFEVGDVYSYLIKDEKIVLVDCGQHTDSAYEQLKNKLREQGLSLNDLDEIWLTHGHPDHYGQAARLAEESGALVYGHADERANFAGNSDAELFEELFKQHGIPNRYIEKMVEQLEWVQQFQLPMEPEWIEEGDQLNSGKLTADVKLTPGHSPGHVCYTTNTDVIFGGDLLLEHISTNALINFDPTTGNRNKSLLQYRNSLRWISLQQKKVLPGHGKSISNPSKIAQRNLNEQEKRYRQIQAHLAEQAVSLVELAQRMFADAIKKGALFLALSEILGYLDWGEQEGLIHKETKSGRITYYRESA